MIKSMVYIGILCFLTFTVVNINAAYVPYSTTRPVCPRNEEYNVCGSACPPSCSDLFYPHRRKQCSKECVRGCFCKEGLYRADNGECLEPEKCCNCRTEVYTTCGTYCPERCDYKPQVCVDVCVEGCFCKDGLIRKDNSTNSPCINPKQC